MTVTTHISAGHPITQLASSLAARLSARRSRRQFRRLLDLDDHMLDDLGVKRHEVQWAASLPLEQDAGQALARVSSERRRRKL